MPRYMSKTTTPQKQFPSVCITLHCSKVITNPIYLRTIELFVYLNGFSKSNLELDKDYTGLISLQRPPQVRDEKVKIISQQR